MRKERLAIFSLSFFMSCGSALCADNTALMEKNLSMQYGAPVTVELDEQKCRLVFPKADIVEEVDQTQNSSAAQQTQPVQRITTIPETVLTCSKINDFHGMAQYKAFNTSSNKAIAQFYNLTTLTFFKDVALKSYQEEFSFVPELGLISSSKIQADDVSYTSTDQTTGLKSEIGHLKNLTLTQDYAKNGQDITYKTDARMELLNVAMPFFSLQIQSEHQAADMSYAVPEGHSFDYAEIWRNFAYLTASKSRAIAQNIKIGVDMMGFNATFDIDTKSDVRKNGAGLFDFLGTFIAQNLKISGVDIGAVKNIHTFGMKYDIRDVNIQSAAKLIELQKEMQKNPNQDINDGELAKLLDDMFDKAKIDMSVKAVYPNAEMSSKSNFIRKNNYLIGDIEVKVDNLYNIFPEQKHCVVGQTVQQTPECALFAGLGEYVDLSKDSSSVIFKLTEQGIFRDGRKVGEPIELNFQKMQQENAAKQQKQEEQIRQLMQENDAMTDVSALGEI